VLERRRAPATELFRPVDARVPGLEEVGLPGGFPTAAAPEVVVRGARVQPGERCAEPVPQLVTEPDFVGAEAQVHGRRSLARVQITRFGGPTRDRLCQTPPAHPNLGGLYMPVLADADFSVGEFLLWLVWIFLFVVWFWLLIMIFSDIFRRHDIHGGVKTLWVIFVIVLPFLGIFIYLITQSKGMAERNIAQAQAQQEQLRQIVGTSSADELMKLDQLKANGSISDDEYQKMRAKVIG
jgi:hypothetical protein